MGGIRQELDEAQLQRLAAGPVSPRPEGEVRDPEHRAALERLWRATGERGLPMPGGFLLDPFLIEAQVPLPSPRPAWQVALALHPRFGMVIGGGSGSCSIHAIEPVPHVWSIGPARLGQPRPLARSWPELLDHLWAFDDAQRMPYALWIRIGESQLSTQPLPGRWRELWHVLDARRRDHLLALTRLLSAAPRSAYPGHFWWTRGDALTLLALGDDLLLGCSSADDLAHALEYAHTAQLPVQPEAWDGEHGYARARAPAPERVIYELAATGTPAFALRVARDGAELTWVKMQDDTALFEKQVTPGRVPAAEALVLPGASPRLQRYLGSHAMCRIPALCSVAGVERWLATDAPPGWDCLAAIERDAGGLLLGPHWGLINTDRLGPFLMLEDRASLERLGLNSADEADAAEGIPPEDCVQQPWPFLCRQGIELAVIGLVRERCDSALCADRAGAIYFADHEFGSLHPQAESVLGLLEKRALRWQLHGEGSGVGAIPALAIALDIGDTVAADLGFARVAEASDRISATLLAPDGHLVIHHAWPPQRPVTELYTHDPARAVAVARALRAHHPTAPLYIRETPGDPIAVARRAALEAADLAPLEIRTWYDWGRWS